ncbi:MAG: hypothetical protein NTX45_01700 [Proteobacteria bacterium]|nr:hypothetical protein [Pseudomonadota bacterium]
MNRHGNRGRYLCGLHTVIRFDGADGRLEQCPQVNRIRRAATLCRRGKNKFIVGMGMPTYS